MCSWLLRRFEDSGTLDPLPLSRLGLMDYTAVQSVIVTGSYAIFKLSFLRLYAVFLQYVLRVYSTVNTVVLEVYNNCTVLYESDATVKNL